MDKYHRKAHFSMNCHLNVVHEKMKTYIITIAVLLMVTGCTRDKVIGTWQTPPHDSELGPVVESVVFRPDATCIYTLADAESPEDQMVATSKWHRSGSTIKIEAKPGEYTELKETGSGGLTVHDSEPPIRFQKQ